MKPSSDNAEEDSEVKQPPKPPENWNRCHAYLERKKRFCRQQRQASSVFCGNHQHLEVSPSKSNGRKRIPCPLDPSHMIYEDMVDKHILICPRAKKRKRQEALPYFKENVNCGGCGSLCAERTPFRDETKSLEWAQRIALRVLQVHQKLFQGTSTKSSNEKSPSLMTLNDLYEAIPLRDHSQQEMDAGIAESFQSNRIKSGGSRHVPQLASLVGHLRAMEVLPQLGKIKHAPPADKPLVLLEMGAGRGMFGLTAAGVAGAGSLQTHLVMLERTGSRSKADKIFRSLPKHDSTDSSYLKLDEVHWSRIGCDLSHVDLPRVLSKGDIDDPKIVVIAKHLCGAGTDLALKSLEPIKERLNACILATCCHGVCDWKEYVGRDFLRKEMEDGDEGILFGSTEFDLLRRWCAGAVACQSAKNDAKVDPSSVHTQNEINVEHSNAPTNEFPSDKGVNISSIVCSLNLHCGIQGLGRACQRLIDYGRLEYLRSEIFSNTITATVDLCHYVPSGVSPQNAALVAYHRQGKRGSIIAEKAR